MEKNIIYYNDIEFVKIYKIPNADLYEFINNNYDLFKLLCPLLTHLIYEGSSIKGYIIRRGKDLGNNKKWGCETSNGYQLFLDSLEAMKINLITLIKKKYYYVDIKPKNIILLDSVFSFIDIENFVKLDIKDKFYSKYLNKDHWYCKEINISLKMS
jgi:hypothetical protein